jgi:hypothetical protein
MTPTLASLFIGEWFGPAPTIIGIVLLAFWAWVKWSNRPVERLNFRFMGVVLLVISSSLWLGFEKGGASTTGYGGDFGAFFSGRFADGWISTLAMFMVGLAALLSIPLATDWLFLPMFLKYRTKQGLAAAPVLGSVGGYKIVGAYAHEGSAPPAAPGTQSAPEVDAPNETEAPSATRGRRPRRGRCGDRRPCVHAGRRRRRRRARLSRSGRGSAVVHAPPSARRVRTNAARQR